MKNPRTANEPQKISKIQNFKQILRVVWGPGDFSFLNIETINIVRYQYAKNRKCEKFLFSKNAGKITGLRAEFQFL